MRLESLVLSIIPLPDSLFNLVFWQLVERTKGEFESLSGANSRGDEAFLEMFRVEEFYHRSHTSATDSMRREIRRTAWTDDRRREYFDHFYALVREGDVASTGVTSRDAPFCLSVSEEDCSTSRIRMRDCSTFSEYATTQRGMTHRFSVDA